MEQLLHHWLLDSLSIHGDHVKIKQVRTCEGDGFSLLLTKELVKQIISEGLLDRASDTSDMRYIKQSGMRVSRPEPYAHIEHVPTGWRVHCHCHETYYVNKNLAIYFLIKLANVPIPGTACNLWFFTNDEPPVFSY
jgi:hypothetical protein